jgi:hypothetical protein
MMLILGITQAHERGLNSDQLLAFLKPLLRERADLRVVIMSASMDEALFSNYFGGCPVLQVEGRWVLDCHVDNYMQLHIQCRQIELLQLPIQLIWNLSIVPWVIQDIDTCDCAANSVLIYGGTVLNEGHTTIRLYLDWHCSCQHMRHSPLPTFAHAHKCPRLHSSHFFCSVKLKPASHAQCVPATHFTGWVADATNHHSASCWQLTPPFTWTRARCQHSSPHEGPLWIT